MVATVFVKDTLVLGLQEWFRRLTTGKMPVARRICLLVVMMLSLDPESGRDKRKNASGYQSCPCHLFLRR
jgi:hypothetical protein